MSNDEFKLFYKPGVNFTKVLRAAFALTDPESAKHTVKVSASFCTFGIWACKTF